ncbi:MAG: ferrous iron transport protein B [Rhodothermaceae bacterium]
MNENKEILVALAGNPNCGKTSLFNILAGANQKVGNFSGVTVEKYEGVTTYKGFKIRIIDLPGSYSLTSYSPEEIVARNFLTDEKTDVVINVIDSTNLERNLYLTTQLMDLKSNLIVALNMFDEVKAKNIKIDLPQLEKLLGAHLVPTSAAKGDGIDDLLDHIVDLFTGKIEAKKNKLSYSEFLEEKIELVTKILESSKDIPEKYDKRWLAIKLLANDQNVYKMLKELPVWIKLSTILSDTIKEFEQTFEEDPEMIIAEERYSFIKGALKETVSFPGINNKSFSEKLDRILINRITGLPIFIFFMWAIFQLTFQLGETPMTWIESFFEFLGNQVSDLVTEPTLRAVLVDGIIAGVGGVLVFLPNILILFLSLALLEGTGYMARAAFVIDKIMHKFGLHGKSFIPMVTGFGCSVPAFMATRTLKNESDRITTLLIIPFMSCGAKYPVYVLILGSFFAPGHAGNILFAIYTFGVLIAMLSSKIFKKTIFKDESEPFVMELPPYRMPTLRTLIMQMWHKAKMYLRKAGTVILVASVLIWIISNYPHSETIEQQANEAVSKIEMDGTLTDTERSEQISQLRNLESTQQLQHSIAGRLGQFTEPVLRPLGFDWRIGIALVTGLAAKEVVVSTMGTIFAVGDADENSQSLRESLRSDPKYNMAVALSIMIFVLLYVPCLSATVVFHREAGKWKWTRLYILYSSGVAWIMSFIVYNIAKLFL